MSAAIAAAYSPPLPAVASEARAAARARNMMGGLGFSVALCTFNGGPYVLEQLDSIAAQTRLPDEVVVCDDRSEDDTVLKVERFASGAAFPVRLHVNERRLGVTKNFEKAISLCAGDVIFLADQDDVWRPQKLQSLGDVFAGQPGVGAAISDATLVDERLRPLGATLWRRLGFGRSARRHAAGGRMVEVLLKRNVATGATMAFRSAFRDLVLPIPREWVHDGWISLLVAMVADFAVLEDSLLLYRQHPQQQIGGVKRPSVTVGELGTASRKIWNDAAGFSLEGSENCVAALTRFTLARERLTERGVAEGSAGMAPLEEKIGHFEARVALPRGRAGRLPRILGELLSGRYRSYSRGMASAFKDLARQG